MPCLCRISPRHVGLGVVHLGRQLGEAEARNDVGHEPHAAVVDLRHQLFPVRLIDQAQHGGGVRVVDELVRQEGVQQRLDGRVGCRGIEQVDALEVDHVLVGERGQRAQLPQRAELDRRQAGGLDGAHVPARALDAQHLVRLAEQVLGQRLDRRVAAAVQHQRGIAPQQPRRVGAQRDVGADALAAVVLHG